MPVPTWPVRWRSATSFAMTGTSLSLTVLQAFQPIIEVEPPRRA
jgi:hypothetical protein